MDNVPVDRGWAWLVLIGCFLNTFFVIGGMKSIGIMLVQVEEYFGTSPSVAGWMIGLQYLGLSFVSPVATVLGERYTYRCVVFIGGTVMAAGFFLSALIRNVYAVIIILGLFIGIGNGFLFTPSLTMVNKYFDRYRSAAMGVVMGGGSVGQLAIPVLLRYLLDELSFYGCCIVYAGITMNTLVAAMLLRPSSFYMSRKGQLHPKNMNEDKQTSGKYYLPQEQNGKIPLHNNFEKLPESVSEIQTAVDHRLPSLDENLDKTPNYSHRTKITDVNNSIQLATFSKNKEDGVNKNKENEDHPNKQTNYHPCHPFIMMFDKSVTGKYVFWVYDIAVCLANAGYLCQFFMLPSYGKEIGISKQEVAWILAISGLVDLVARIIGGIIDNIRIISTGIIISVSLFITGITVTICLLFPGFSSLLAHSVMLGFFGGMYISLYPIALVEFLGLDLFPKALSLIVMSMGFVILPLPNLFGEIYDLVGSYQPTMWLCIVAMVIGGVLVAFEPLVKKIDDRRANDNNTDPESGQNNDKHEPI